MTLVRLYSTRLWAGTACAGVLMLLAGCGGDDLRCGEGTVEQEAVCVPSPSQPAPPAKDTTLTITSIDFAQDGPIYENHKMTARVGLKGKGKTDTFHVALGLMEAPPTQGDIPANLSNCLLVDKEVQVVGDEQEHVIDLDFTVGADCHPGKHHNFFISHAPQESAGQSAWDVTVFSARDAQKEQNQQCRKPGGEAGCVYDIDLRQSPGLDLELTQLVPSSRVAVVYPDAPSGHAHPLLTLGAEISLHGLERNADAPIPGEALHLTYSIAPHRGNSQDWQPLAINDTTTLRHPITRITPHKPLHVSNHLYAPQAVQDRLQGAWAQENIFNLRACVEGSFEQKGDPQIAGESGKDNDCRTLTIQLVRAPSHAGQHASIQSWNYSWSQTYGGSTLSLTPSFSTANVIDLTGSQIPQAGGKPQQGAMAQVNGQANLGGSAGSLLASAPLFQGTAQAVAYVAVDNSFVSVNVNAFGVNLYGFNQKANIPNPLFSKDWNVVKQQCESDVIVVVAIPVTLQFCVSGTIGLKGQLNILHSGVQGQQGQGGQVQGSATPYANLGASASASVGIPGASIGVQGSLSVLNVQAPLSTTLDWGITHLSPLTMDITGTATWALTLSTLNGEIDLVLNYPTVHWCSSWHIPYPCGPWSDTYTRPLYSFQGPSWNYPFLNVNQSLSLSL